MFYGLFPLSNIAVFVTRITTLPLTQVINCLLKMLQQAGIKQSGVLSNVVDVFRRTMSALLGLSACRTSCCAFLGYFVSRTNHCLFFFFNFTDDACFGMLFPLGIKLELELGHTVI